jgi:hypothetical protein
MVAAPTIIRDEGEGALLASYRQALPAERDCMADDAGRVSAGEDWCSSLGQMLGQIGRTIPRRRLVPCVPAQTSRFGNTDTRDPAGQVPAGVLLFGRL